VGAVRFLEMHPGIRDMNQLLALGSQLPGLVPQGPIADRLTSRPENSTE
jgi:hypothetical protein